MLKVKWSLGGASRLRGQGNELYFNKRSIAAFSDVVLSGGDAQLALAEKLLHDSLASSEIDELCELISNEFLMSGIEENFEPNSYGLELELLLDAVNRGRSEDVDSL